MRSTARLRCTASRVRSVSPPTGLGIFLAVSPPFSGTQTRTTAVALKANLSNQVDLCIPLWELQRQIERNSRLDTLFEIAAPYGIWGAAGNGC
jgi:hypothetical protein